MSASRGDLREVLAGYRAVGSLREIAAPVAAKEEVAGVLSATEIGGPVLLHNVGEYRVIGNLLTSRQQIAQAIGLAAFETGQITDRMIVATAHPIATQSVTDGLVSEVVVDNPDLTKLPFPHFFERETGAYITGGIVCVTDVVTGERNLSYARFKILGSDLAMLGVSPNHHLGRMAQRAKEAGKTLPIAVVLGVHPAITLAACLYLGFGDDELEVAGALLGAPIEVIPVAGGDVWVPADAELVLEGEVLPEELIVEGLVSEFHGRYHDYGLGIATRFTTMRHRKDPIVPVVVPGLHSEHLLLASVPIAVGLKSNLRRIEPGVCEVAVPDAGAGRTSAVISVRNLPPGRAKQLMFTCWSVVPLIKQVVIVDAEIDPWNSEAVEWARLMHARPERDFLVVPDARTDRSDPQVRNFQVGKLGVDATAKPGDRAEGWEFARVPQGSRGRAREILADAGIVAEPSAVNAGINYGLGNSS